MTKPNNRRDEAAEKFCADNQWGPENSDIYRAFKAGYDQALLFSEERVRGPVEALEKIETDERVRCMSSNPEENCSRIARAALAAYKASKERE